MEEFESIEALAQIPVNGLVELLIVHGKKRFEDPIIVDKNYNKQYTLLTGRGIYFNYYC